MATNIKKTKKGFNGMDLFIILALAVIIAAAVFLLRGIIKNDTAEKDKVMEIEYTLEFKARPSSSISFVKEGDDVRDPDTKQSIGTVVAVQSVPFKLLSYNYNDGSVKMAEYPDLYDLLITIRASATHDDTGYYTGGARFLVGKASNMVSQGFVGTGYCVSIREIDAGGRK